LISSVLLLLSAIVFIGWMRTSSHLAAARAQGIYAPPEQGMRERAKIWYSGDPEVEIMYAGPNAHNGMQPHMWYVIAEVRAQARSDGSSLEPNHCDAPGSFSSDEGWLGAGTRGQFSEVDGYLGESIWNSSNLSPISVGTQ
jgi:hypothetical protein